MNVVQALEKVKESSPAEAGIIEQYIQDLRAKDVVALATNEAFALRDSTGDIKAFKQRVRLAATDGTLVSPVPGGPFVISAMGYTKLAEASGVIIMNAPTVLVEGREEQNPYVYRDKSNGRILAIYCRAIAFRYSSKGIPQVSDRTTIFDTPAYRMIDLLGKAKNFPQAFRLLPRDMPKPEGTWAGYSFDEASCLYVDTSHEEALQFFAQIINREKKAMEFAQTFAQRNAVKHLLGLQAVPGQVRFELVEGTNKKTGKPYSFTKSHITPKDTWDVEVICWRPVNGNIIKWDGTKYAQIQKNIAAVAAGNGDVMNALPGGLDGVKIDLTRGTDRISEEAHALAEMADPEDRAELAEQGFDPEDPDVLDMTPDESGSFEATTPSSAVSESLSRQLGAAARSLPEEYQKAKANLGIAIAPANDDEARKLLAEINRIADSGE